MQRLNTLIGKAVVHRDTGERVGKSSDVLVSQDGGRVVGVVIGGGMLTGDTGVLPSEQVQSFGGDVIMAKGEHPVVDVEEWRARALDTIRSSSFAHRRLVTKAGEDLGAIEDVCIDEAGMVRAYQVADAGFAGLVQRHRLIEPLGDATIGPDVVIVERAMDSTRHPQGAGSADGVETRSAGTATPAARPSTRPETSPINPIPGQPIEPRT